MAGSPLIKLCECGCGEKTRYNEKKKCYNDYIQWHHTRGENNPFYGHKHSEEDLQKMRDNHADFSKENHPKWGKHFLHSEETKQSISEKLSNRILSEEHKYNIGLASKGRYVSETTRQKISDGNKGKIRSEEWKQNMSMRVSKEGNPNWNKPMPEEQRELIRNTLRGTSHSGSYKKNHETSNEVRQSIRMALLNKHHTEETKQKIRDNMPDRSGDKNPMFGKPAPIGSGRGHGSYCKKGHWVRSRWERKWFDMLFDAGILYLYEPKSFKFEDGTSYRPDCYIPGMMLWVEIKGNMEMEDINKHMNFTNLGYKLLILEYPSEFKQELGKLKEKYF